MTESSPGIINIKEDSNNEYQLEEEWEIDYSKPLNKKSDANYCIGVYLATSKRNGSKAVLKIVSQEDRNPSYESEIKTYGNLMNAKHENIIKILDFRVGDFKEKKNCLFIFMEYKEGYKTILNFLNEGYKFTEYQISLVALYLIYALTYLHNERIIHRDIKCSNILIHFNDDGKIDIKLIDFGFSKFYGDNKSNYITFAGTPTHLAPEVFFQNNKAGRVSDIWSVGCTLIEMASGDLKKLNGLPVIPSHLSNQLKNFIQHCLIVKPENRSKAIELIHHKFIQLEDVALSNINQELFNNSKVINSIELNNQQFNEIDTIESHITNVTLSEFNDQDLNIVFNKLPTTVTTLSLPVFNHPIEKGIIPFHIQSLHIQSFNHNLDEDTIPPNITELVLGESFDFNDNGGDLPDEIKKFSCSYKFGSQLKKNNNIPKEVSTLVLDNYNYPIVKGCIPSSVHTLTLGSSYQDHLGSLKNLSQYVINLTIGVSNECTLTDDEIIQESTTNIDEKTQTRKLVLSVTNFIIKRN